MNNNIIEENILMPEYAPEGKRCIGCKFYYRYMSKFSVQAIIKHFETEGELIHHQTGQKFCLKINRFT